MGIWGLNFFLNVKIQWISMVEPLKHVMEEYKTLIVKMSQDNVFVAQAKLNLDLLCDLHRLLGLFCLLPLLEVVNALINFVQKMDVFIYKFIVVIRIAKQIFS
jgi:hypothetical protein